ncbi:hypothetical protein M153_9000020845 [Pseudoloma neurophilia]|uniref:Uncharacterized protein n=1 Tax=Pseudoloma neurophilia TaxID=146866 RepID=A0A0R0M062_9MICR|nr:hypothetical protein M153_9000020845 [Pseudoloma neurophilia]
MINRTTDLLNTVTHHEKIIYYMEVFRFLEELLIQIVHQKKIKMKYLTVSFNRKDDMMLIYLNTF